MAYIINDIIKNIEFQDKFHKLNDINGILQKYLTFLISNLKDLKEMQIFILNCKIFTCCPYTFRVGEPLSLWSLILLQKFSRWKVFILPFFNSLWGSISEKQGLHSGNFF